MTRVWLRRDEITGILDLFRRELKGEVTHIPFQRVLPILIKAEPSRLIWSRTAKQEFARWGVKVGLRNNQEAFVVRVVDPERWRLTNSKPIQNEPPLVQDRPLDDDENGYLIPAPDSDYVMPAWVEHLNQSIEHGENVLLTGPCGAGKSSIVKELCAKTGRKFLRINLSSETSASHLLGQWVIQNKEMIFRYGPVPQAMRIGAVLLIDELDLAKSEIVMVLQRLLEDERTLHLPDTNEWIEAHQEFRVVATANTIGKGDDSGLYVGTNVLNEAFLDRFHSVYQVDYLPMEKELELLRSKVKGLRYDIADKMIRVADALRKALKDGVIYSSFSTRKLLIWAKKVVLIGDPRKAAEFVILNKLTQDDRNVVVEVLQRIFGN